MTLNNYFYDYKSDLARSKDIQGFLNNIKGIPRIADGKWFSIKPHISKENVDKLRALGYLVAYDENGKPIPDNSFEPRELDLHYNIMISTDRTYKNVAISSKPGAGLQKVLSFFYKVTDHPYDINKKQVCIFQLEVVNPFEVESTILELKSKYLSLPKKGLIGWLGNYLQMDNIIKIAKPADFYKASGLQYQVKEQEFEFLFDMPGSDLSAAALLKRRGVNYTLEELKRFLEQRIIDKTIPIKKLTIDQPISDISYSCVYNSKYLNHIYKPISYLNAVIRAGGIFEVILTDVYNWMEERDGK